MGDREDAGVRGHKMRVGRGGLSSRGQEIKKMSINSVNYLASITFDCSSNNVVIGINCPGLAKITRTDQPI